MLLNMLIRDTSKFANVIGEITPYLVKELCKESRKHLDWIYAQNNKTHAYMVSDHLEHKLAKF